MVPGRLPPAKAGEHRLSYPAPETGVEGIHPYVKDYENGVRRGQQVVRTLLPLRQEGFEPDVIYVHPGWGDGLYLKDLFPNTRLVGLFEFFYRPRGADVGFDPELPMSFNDIFRVRSLNTLQLYALDACDAGIVATEWQRSRYPTEWQSKLHPIHEGVVTDLVTPDDGASFDLPSGRRLTRSDKVVTYVSRTLEPYRGFHQFMRALPALQCLQPDAEIVIAGSDEGPGYGPPPRTAATWKAKLLEELGGGLDLSRLHFVGKLEYEAYLALLRVSRAHVYLTYPFVLSWSMLEAMSAGCVVIASRTAPVTEVIEHGINGLLVDFFDPAALAAQISDVLSHPQSCESLSAAARATVVLRYDFTRQILPRHLAFLELPPQPGPDEARAERSRRGDTTSTIAEGMEP